MENELKEPERRHASFLAPLRTRNINLRLTHPTLYRSVIVFAFISMGLGLNFWFTKPTFNPYGVDYRITGSVFLTLGVSKIVFLVWFRNLRLIRFNMACCAGFMMFWGIGTSVTYFTGHTSLQLFVLYSGLTLLQLFLLLEPYVNPLTSSNGGPDGPVVDNS